LYIYFLRMMKELSEDNLTLNSSFKITTADTDMYMRVRLGGIVNLLIQSAINSAESLGFGFKGLRKQQLYWVLSRMTVEVYQPLVWNQEVEVETWPKTIEGLLYMRDFIVRDKLQNIIARATSGWLAIDAETKRPKFLDRIEAEMFMYLKDKHALNELPEKLPPTSAGETFHVQSGYFDFDLNRHVTSTRYVDWMMDSYSVDFHKTNYPKLLSINFMKETLPGDSLSIIRNNHDSQFSFEGTNLLQKTVAFRGKIEF